MAALDWSAADRGETTARLAQPPFGYILAADCCYVDPGGQGFHFRRSILTTLNSVSLI